MKRRLVEGAMPARRCSSSDCHEPAAFIVTHWQDGTQSFACVPHAAGRKREPIVDFFERVFARQEP